MTETNFLRIRDVSFRPRFPGQIPSGIYVVAAEVDRGAARGMSPPGIKEGEEGGVSIIVHGQKFSLNRQWAIRGDQLGTWVQDVFDAVLFDQLGCGGNAGQRLGAKQVQAENVGFRP